MQSVIIICNNRLILTKIKGIKNMKRKKILFIGDNNTTNSGLYKLLTRRFHAEFCKESNILSSEDILSSQPAAIVVSMIGGNTNYSELFEMLKNNETDIPVITIGTKTETDAYENYYKEDHFYKILRPVTGQKILNICYEITENRNYSNVNEPDSEEQDFIYQTEPYHILIVDDNAMVLRNIKAILDEKYTVSVAASGIQAFVSIGKKMPDLILLDYEMPEMNGKAVMQKIQAEPDLCHIPIVFLTGTDAKEIVMELLALKPAGYILKPTDAETLNQKIEDILGK